MTFFEWRKLMNGENDDSNMQLIDKAFADLSDNIGGGIGTVTEVDDVSPNDDGNIELFKMITIEQLDEMIANPELMEDGVKYYTIEEPINLSASDVLTNENGVTVQDALDRHSAMIHTIVFSEEEPTDPVDGMIWLKPV